MTILRQPKSRLNRLFLDVRGRDMLTLNASSDLECLSDSSTLVSYSTP